MPSTSSVPAAPVPEPNEVATPRPRPHDAGEPQALAWWARVFLGLAGVGTGCSAIWALMLNGKEGAMPTAMIILGALLVLIALGGYLPDKLWAGDSGIQFARRLERRELQKAADMVADNTPPGERKAVIDELTAADPDLANHHGGLPAPLEADGRPWKRGRAAEPQFTWGWELRRAMERASSLERDVLHSLDAALPKVAKNTGQPLRLEREGAGLMTRADYEVTWPPNRRILIDVRLQTKPGSTDFSRVGREAISRGERLGLLILTSDSSATLSNLLLLETGLREDIGGPVMVRPVGNADNLAGYLEGLIRAVED